MKKQSFKNTATSFALLTVALGTSSCTQQLANSFRLLEQNQSFAVENQLNTKVDLLWVVDNSSSMGVEQDRLRQGFAGFANKYLLPTLDIQVAVITTDTYLANAAFTSYLTTPIANTTGVVSPYIHSLGANFVNPSNNPTLVNTGTGAFTNGVRPVDLVPSWTTNYALLQPGIHDGPLEGLCFEGMSWFFYDSSDCSVRDTSIVYTGTTDCLNPTGSNTADDMCINTVENNTMRSGIAIIKTKPPSPLTGAALTNWQNQLIANFQVNASTGVDGMGSERGLGSVLEVLNDNEVTASAFFRKGSIRGIIFVSDEDDQTQPITTGSNVGPWDNYMCDQSSLVALNSVAEIEGPTRNFCCTGGSCTYGANGTSCPAKNIDGTDWTVSICPEASALMPVATVKTQLDTFFETLDGTTSTPNYFIATITPLSMDSITTLQALHNTDDANAGYPQNQAVDRGDRYLDLGNLVGNGSLSLDISATDYSPLLDQIGQEIAQQLGTFQLARIPTDQEDMTITVTHADGSTTSITSADYTISGNSVIITDTNLVLSFVATDSLSINYEPKYVTQ